MAASTPATQRRVRGGRYLAPLGLVALAAAIAVLIIASPGRVSPPHARHHRAARSHAPARRLPPYWTVHPGDTFGQIAARTGLPVAALERLNPNVDPQALLPGERLNLWRHPPRPRPKPLGPRFWTVRPGQSFGSIAAHTGINLTALERLNPHVKPATLQPGERVRLRR